MYRQMNRPTVVVLVLGLVTLLILGASNLPAYAQEGAGDQLRELVEPLVRAGEGDAVAANFG